jgi:Mor family transcriptional regulator
METKQFYKKALGIAKKLKLIQNLGGKCSVCGETRYWVLEFHHISNKEFDIGNNRHSRFSLLEQETKKCICLCSNCHREIHDNQTIRNPNNAKMKMLDYKNVNCCSKCKYSKNTSALDFHHINPNTKKFDLSKYSLCKTKLPTNIKQELDKCIVLCSNCHKTEHYDTKFFEDNKDYILKKSENIKEIPSAVNKDEVLRLFDSGMKATNIAKLFNVTDKTISVILKTFKKTKQRCDRIEFERLVNLGYNRKQLMEHFSINEKTVRNIIKELNLEIPKQRKSSQ